jgi:hypothetical protein
LLLPETTTADGLLQRLQEQMTDCAFGFSWGGAVLPEDASEPKALVTTADARLYAHKRTKK